MDGFSRQMQFSRKRPIGYNTVSMTFCSDGKNGASSDHLYMIGLAHCPEDYEHLSKYFGELLVEIAAAKEISITLNDQTVITVHGIIIFGTSVF